MKKEKFDLKQLRFYPYRGILSEIAKKRGKQRSTICMQIIKGNKTTIELVQKMANERLAHDEKIMKSKKRVS